MEGRGEEMREGGGEEAESGMWRKEDKSNHYTITYMYTHMPEPKITTEIQLYYCECVSYL